MQPNSLSELASADPNLTGNAAKIKVLIQLRDFLIRNHSPKILDIGSVGPDPFNLWRSLLGRYRFHLTGVDVGGIDKAERIATQRGWGQQVSIRKGSGYDLKKLFPAGSFDAVVATQVLEHVSRLPSFMRQVTFVLAAEGHAWFTFDSANWLPRYTPRRPVRLLKNIVKKGLSLSGHERHYDLPWSDEEVIRACEQAGLKVLEVGYYNLPDLKFLHNHVVPPARQNEFLMQWYELEELLNGSSCVRDRIRSRFMGIFVHAAKPAVRHEGGCLRR